MILLHKLNKMQTVIKKRWFTFSKMSLYHSNVPLAVSNSGDGTGLQRPMPPEVHRHRSPLKRQITPLSSSRKSTPANSGELAVLVLHHTVPPEFDMVKAPFGCNTTDWGLRVSSLKFVHVNQMGLWSHCRYMTKFPSACIVRLTVLLGDHSASPADNFWPDRNTLFSVNQIHAHWSVMFINL